MSGMPNFLLIFGVHGLEYIVIAIVGLLLFGKKLPGVARSLGQSVVEFKKGIKGMKDEINDSSNKSASQEAAAPKTIDVAASSPAPATPVAAETAEVKAE